MPIRTTDEAVALIIEVDDTIDLTPFIATASSLVDVVCATALDGNGDPFYLDPELEMIERWLAAHCYTVRDPRAVSQSAGVSQTVQSAVAVGFSTSHYGQMAVRLDRAGGLAALDEQSKNPDETVGGAVKHAAMFWLGTDRRSNTGEIPG